MDDPASIAESIKVLDMKRQSLELEGAVIVSELEAPPEGGGAPMGVTTPLVDSQGFPRGDVDVIRARTLRARWNEIRTDLKAMGKEMEVSLIQLAALRNPKLTDLQNQERMERTAEKPLPKFDGKTGKWVVRNWDGSVAGVPGGDQRQFDNLDMEDDHPRNDDKANTTNDVTMDVDVDVSIETEPCALIPFARINFVSPDSPAAEAFLEENDLVLEFGGINHTNHDCMNAIADLVSLASSRNEELEVKILREGSELLVKLKPRPWGGRGLLGCHVVKY